MPQYIFWRPETVHEGRRTSGGKWRGIIGAVGAVGATAYLVPSLVDGRNLRGGHLLEVADIQHAPNNINTDNLIPQKPHSSPRMAWQSLPLLALQSSSEIAENGVVRLLALQAAFERERNSAAVAQGQVGALQEQLANLWEKQEEVLVLREQLADAESHAKQMTEPRSVEAEQKKRADNAVFRIAALQEELANLGAEVLKAKATAEGETARAASALAQLEAVQHQLAVATALQSSRTETDNHLRPKHEGLGDEPPFSDPGDVHTEERGSTLPPNANAALQIKQRQASLRKTQPDRSIKAMTDKPRQALLGNGDSMPARPVSKAATAPFRALDPDVRRLTRPRHEPTSQNTRPHGTPAQRASQQSRLLAQERRDTGALSLPSDLLPDSRLW